MLEIGTWRVGEIEHHPEAGRGALTVINNLEEDLPFRPKRLFWLTGLEPGMNRGGHAHKGQSQVFIVLSGSATFSLYNQRQSHEVVELRDPTRFLALGPLAWVTLMRFAPGTVVLVLADGTYDEEDYLRTEPGFLAYRAPEPPVAEPAPPAEGPASESPTPRQRRTPRSATASSPP